MKRFEILPHLADLKIMVRGRNKEELFANALLAMSESMRADTTSQAVRRKIEVKSIDLNALLVDFLSEVLVLSQINKEVYSYVNFGELSETRIKAELVGKKVKTFGEDIKAVTYHGLAIKKKSGLLEVIIIFDI